MRTFRATVRLSNGLHQEVEVRAGSQLAARAMIKIDVRSWLPPTGAMEFRADAVIAAIFGVPLLIAGAMIDPQGLHLGGLLAYSAIVFVILPFIAWPSFLLSAVFRSAGESRSSSVLSFWIGASVTATGVISWLYSVLSYPRPDAQIDPSGHLLIPFMPRAGLAIGLFALCVLVSSGVWGAASSILRPEVAISGALVSGCVLFVVFYGGGWLLIIG